MKKIFATIICAIMALSMAACGSSENEDSTEATTSKADVETTTVSEMSDSYEGITELNTEIEADIEETVDGLYVKYDELLEKAGDYDGFIANMEDVESFYSAVREETRELCIRMREYSVSYAECILNSGASADEMYDSLDGLYDDIYDGALDEVYENIYNGLLDEVYDAFYNGILDEAYDYVDYSEWLSTSSDEYSRWLNCSSDVYSEWLNGASDVYSFWLDLSSALYLDDVDKAYEEIDSFIGDIDNIKNGVDTEEEETEETITNEEITSSEVEETTTVEMTTEEKTTEEATTSGESVTNSSEELVDGMRVSFKEAMDSYEAFYDEYCDFLEEYYNNPSDLTLLARYTELVAKEVEMNEKFEAWDEEEMNDAELKYYLEVSNRVMQRLLEVAQY